MYLDQYQQKDGDIIRISPDQASRFAKDVAGDFNPLHNADAKRFCVPGDLLFSSLLGKYGIHAKMCFVFKDMVGKDVDLNFAPTTEREFDLNDVAGKTYVSVAREGELINDESKIEMLTKTYVAFSGKTFPYILVPLLEEQGVMINPARPLVIYERMNFEFKRLDFSDFSMRSIPAELTVNGKRGTVVLNFEMLDGDEVIGRGSKHMVIGGLVAYDAEAVQGLKDTYVQWKTDYQEQIAALTGC